MELGKKIKQLRYRAGLTQEQLAERMGVGPQAVSKWETAVAMPDIAALPLLAETFGVSIDELFDLTAEQRMNRIENRMDIESELPQDVFWEYEEYLKTQCNDAAHRERATELLAYLYWHRMDSYAQKAARAAKDAVRQNPYKKGSQWIMQKAAGHAVWDWNLNNHAAAVDFYRELIDAAPDCALAYCYLLDNLIADRRADEAERALDRLCALPRSNPVMTQAYRAHIALARFDEPTADRIIETLVASGDSGSLFEAAQYYASKCDYDRAIACYERSFETDPERPRFTDALMGIAVIWEIRRDYRKAAQTYDRIIDLLENEWGLREEVELKHARSERARLLAKA